MLLLDERGVDSGSGEAINGLALGAHYSSRLKNFHPAVFVLKTM
jgi:hypothetical protein